MSPLRLKFRLRRLQPQFLQVVAVVAVVEAEQRRVVEPELFSLVEPFLLVAFLFSKMDN